MLASHPRPGTPRAILRVPVEDILWLRSNLGVTEDPPPAVSVWAEQEGDDDATQAVEALRPDYIAGVVDFDSAQLQTLSIADNVALHYTTAMTIALRVRSDALAFAEPWLTKSTTTGAGDWSIQYAGELRLWFGIPGTAGGAAPAASFAAGQWRTVIIVYDGLATGNANRLRMWVNGVQQTLVFYGTIPATITATTFPITLASWANGLAYFNGAFREIVIAKKVAAVSQVADLYTLLTGGNP